MATVSELMEQGVRRMRLPFWNETAYLEPRPEGPWADIHDGGWSSPFLLSECVLSECDRDNRWIAVREGK